MSKESAIKKALKLHKSTNKEVFVVLDDDNTYAITDEYGINSYFQGNKIIWCSSDF